MCNNPIITKTNHQYCETCRPIHYREYKRESERLRRINNPEKEKARHKAYRDNNRDKINAKSRENRELYIFRLRKLHDLERFGGLRNDVLERDNFKCQHCLSDSNLVIHHVDHDKNHNSLDNLITLCRTCHASIHGKWSEERRKRHSEAAKAAGAGKWMRGRTQPREVTEKITAANKGRRNTPEAIEKMRLAKKQWWANQSQERRKQIGDKISKTKTT